MNKLVMTALLSVSVTYFTAACSSTPIEEDICGDGLLSVGEQCDDGNNISGDGCSAFCLLEDVCGDGVVTGGEQCDDANNTPGDGCSAFCQIEITPSTISPSWSLVEGDQNTPTSCPAGATTIAMVSENGAGDQITDLFDCAQGSGTSGEMPLDFYNVWLQLTDDSGNVLYAQSLATDVQVTQATDHAISFEFSIDRGAFEADWDIVDGAAQSNCAAAGVVWFSLDYTDDQGGFLSPDVFDCENYSGTSAGVPVENWSVSPSFLDSNELAVEVGSSIDTAIEYGNHYNDLGVIVYDLQAPSP